jgi:hypothetical protein
MKNSFIFIYKIQEKVTHNKKNKLHAEKKFLIKFS